MARVRDAHGRPRRRRRARGHPRGLALETLRSVRPRAREVSAHPRARQSGPAAQADAAGGRR
eukprot:6791595-Prymnesium_polylepis.1